MKDISFGKFIIIACLILLTVGYVERGCQAANLGDWFRKKLISTALNTGTSVLKSEMNKKQKKSKQTSMKAIKSNNAIIIVEDK